MKRFTRKSFGGVGRVLGPACGALLLGLSSAGCADVEKVEIPNVFRQMPERPIADVPVPVGFRYHDRGSYIFNNNYRVAKLRYTGGRRLDEVESFYKEQMPLSRWSLVEVKASEEDKLTRTLEFHSDLETCTITVTRRSGFSALDIEIMPRKV